MVKRKTAVKCVWKADNGIEHNLEGEITFSGEFSTHGLHFSANAKIHWPATDRVNTYTIVFDAIYFGENGWSVHGLEVFDHEGVTDIYIKNEDDVRSGAVKVLNSYWTDKIVLPLVKDMRVILSKHLENVDRIIATSKPLDSE